MSRYVLQRILHAIFVIWIVVTAVFLISRATGNPLDVFLPIDALPETRERLTHDLGLDKPLIVQYGLYARDLVTGSWGESIYFGKSVLPVIVHKLPNTLLLAMVAMFLAFLVGIPLGVLSAAKRGGIVDHAANLLAALGQSLPAFWVAILLVQLFSVELGLLPVAGMGTVNHLVLPSVTIAWWVMAGLVRLTHSSMLEILDRDFLVLARAKGVSEFKLIWWHALRNALIPVATFTGIQFVVFATGSIVVETVFAWPGIGRLVYEALVYRDFPLLQGVVMTFAAITVLLNLAVDVLYPYLDPKIRYARPKS